jgi:DNA-binding beta-propeller fold protein YncE
VAFGINYQYRVDGVTAAGRVVASNVQTIAAGTFIALNTQVGAMMVDRTRPYLYAVDTVNNSLHFVNLTSNKLEKTIFIGSKPADLDINVAGTELFVANFGATEVAVVNLDTREKTRALAVNTTVGTWDGNPYRLACTAGDTLVFTSMDQWNDLKLVNAATGAHLFATGSVYTPDLTANADGTRLYVGADEVIRFNVEGNKLTQVDISNRGNPGRRIAATRDGRFVFYGPQKFLADNLKSVLGTFAEPILAVTSDGAIAVGAKNIHDGNTFAIIRALPVSTEIMAMSADETMLYLYDTMSSRIYLHRLK